MEIDETQIPSSYYEANREARKAYQRDYYKRNRKVLARKRQLMPALDPEKVEKLRAYQKEYYLTHRKELLHKRKMRERRKKLAILNPESGTLNRNHDTESGPTSQI
jgi:hypothetical protein